MHKMDVCVQSVCACVWERDVCMCMSVCVHTRGGASAAHLAVEDDDLWGDICVRSRGGFHLAVEEVTRLAKCECIVSSRVLKGVCVCASV